MIDSAKLVAQLESKATSRDTVVKRLENDLRKRCDENPQIDAPLKAQYEAAKARKRTALTYAAWREEELTNIAVAWVLACVFIRFLEDNELVETPKLSGPGARLQRARDEHEVFFRQHPTETEREYLLAVFEETGRLPGMKEFFDRRHNPLWSAAPSGDACRELWQFWQKIDPDTGALAHDFTDPDWNTRFLGDLYQDLSEAARKRYALLQTPVFVEQFILDRTLTPAVETFGFREVRLIDPTCGSGHFLLGGFARLFRLWQEESAQENPRSLVQRALDQVCGVDLNPNVVAIARFRLLLAALQVCGVQRLKDAPDFHIHVAVGDALLHGARFDPAGRPYVRDRQEVFGGEEVFEDELAHFFETEDSAALHRILGRQYHAVVGNPPYITVKDRALSELYRARYGSCSGKYSLSVPFMERFFDLALQGDGTARQPAGFVGQITANSFMKREFGKKLIETFLPRWDLTHVLDTSGAYIPGHGTPTVILFGRNQRPVRETIRTVLGINGEPATPTNPSKGLVWRAICQQIDQPGSLSQWVSAADSSRMNFHQHPWSIGGGGASELKDQLDGVTDSTLSTRLKDAGMTFYAGEDEVFFLSPNETSRLSAGKNTAPLLTGEDVRDYAVVPQQRCFLPYEPDGKITRFTNFPAHLRDHLWRYRAALMRRVFFGKTMSERNMVWYEPAIFFQARFNVICAVSFPYVATHNNFAIQKGHYLNNRHCPLLVLNGSNETEILGMLNSSVGCFWMKQIFFPKGGDQVGREGARVRKTMWDERYEFDATKLASFPIPVYQPTHLPAALVAASTDLQVHASAAVLATLDLRSLAGLSTSGTPLSASPTPASMPSAGLSTSQTPFSPPESRADLPRALAAARAAWHATRQRMISLQEELDWQIYAAFGLVEAADDLGLPEGDADTRDAAPPIVFGERAFEFVLARRMAGGEEQTTWFERHGAIPRTDLPAHWPAAYRARVERRIARIAADANIRLIERPEYKRRWNTEPWDEQLQRAARDWLLARLEGYFHEGQRVCELTDGFSPAAHGFTAAARPHLATANELADVAQTDRSFLEVAESYVGSSGFSVSKLVRELVEGAAVPYLPVQRYKDSGLRKRQDWEHVWTLQRQEDAIDAAEKPDEPGLSDIERARRHADAAARKKTELGDIPVPPKYAGADFLKAAFWKLRGKLDVPKERWVSYPGAERAGDDSLLIAWAGWDHLQQAQALAEYYLDAKDNQGWQSDRLKPLLAGLADLIPWLKQWHDAPDPNLGMGLGDYFAGFLDEQCRSLSTTPRELEFVRLGNVVSLAT